MIKRLKIKFVCIIMTILTVLLCAIFLLILGNTRHDMQLQSYRTIEQIQNSPRGNLPPGWAMGNSFFMYAITEDGQENLWTRGIFEDDDQEALQRIGAEVWNSGEERGTLREENLRFARKRTPQGDVLTFLDISVEQSVMSGLVRSCMKIYLVSFMVFLGISILLAQWAVRPVEKAWNTQRQFVADASHELKTPLTVIMTNGEILQERMADPESEQFVRNILTMSVQMRDLVEGLLQLARVDNGLAKASFTQVDISALVNRCLLPFEPVFFENGMALESALEEGLHCRGSESHLKQVVDILLDNARKYGHTDQPVRVMLQRQGSQGVLSVSTAGEQLSVQALRDIFKRFYRLDKARTMNHSYGLGLSIARGIVSEHRGKIWAESKNGRNTFFVQLPCVASRPQEE